MLGLLLATATLGQTLNNLCTGATHPKGLLFNFTAAQETFNNLGGFPGGETVTCSAGAANLACPDPTAVTACGCGCRCTNAASFAGQPPVLHYSKACYYYDGTGAAPKELDFRVEAVEAYRPWATRENGRSYGGNTFALISTFQNSANTFKMSFLESGTNTPFTVPTSAGLPCCRHLPRVLRRCPFTAGRAPLAPLAARPPHTCNSCRCATARAHTAAHLLLVLLQRRMRSLHDFPAPSRV